MAVIKIGNWTNISAEKITNLYLYGKDSPPSEYYNRLRTTIEYNHDIVLEFDAVTFMSSGPGRFAHASDVGFVQDFYAGTVALSAGTYTRDQLIGTNGLVRTDFVAVYNQALYDTDSPDYALRTYIFGMTSFVISADTQFIVHPNGSRSCGQKI